MQGIPPTANAGINQAVLFDESIVISGSGDDDDGVIEKYLWKFGSSDWIAVTNGDTTIIAPSTEQSYICSLIVTDDDGFSDTDEVIIYIEVIPGMCLIKSLANLTNLRLR